MTMRVPDGLFPLPLAPFETFNLVDDRADYPKTFVIQLTFAGKMDRTALVTAATATLAWHPLLKARVAKSRGHGYVWTLVDDAPAVDWGAAAAPLQNGYAAPVHLRSQCGVALWIRAGAATTKLYARFHHACCDGLGAFSFLADLLAAYHAALSSDAVRRTSPPTVSARLARRGHFEIAPRNLRTRLRDTLVGARGALAFFRQQAAPLAVPVGDQGPPPGPRGNPGFVTCDQDEDVLRALRWVASRAGATLNDLLLRDLFLTLRDWNRDHGGAGPDCRLRVLMPTSLRRRGDREMPAANVMSFAFLTRSASDCEAPGRLLDTIRTETEQIRRYRLSLYFLGTLAALRAVPMALPYFLRGNRCFATAVLTNLGNPTRRWTARLPRTDGRIAAGNLRLEGIAGAAPLRPLTRAALSIVTYANRLCISTRCDPHLFSLEHARDLQARYVAHLQRTAGFPDIGAS